MLPLSRSGFPGADDSNAPFALGICHDEQAAHFREPYAQEARLLAGMNRIRDCNFQRVPKDTQGLRKAYTMLREVRGRLGGIPLELHAPRLPHLANGRPNTGLSGEAPSLAPASAASTHC